MFHALALILSGFLNRRGRAASAAGWLFVLGSLLFSGSLYALSLTGISILGAVTPFGGLAWLLAWVFLALSALRPRTIEALARERGEIVSSSRGEAVPPRGKS